MRRCSRWFCLVMPRWWFFHHRLQVGHITTPVRLLVVALVWRLGALPIYSAVLVVTSMGAGALPVAGWLWLGGVGPRVGLERGAAGSLGWARRSCLVVVAPVTG